MKNLIKELKNNKLDIEKHNELFASAWNSSIDNCCSVLNQYNLITAPKQIKLSEVVSRLRNAFVGLGNIDYKGFIEIGYGFITLDDEKVITIDLDSQKIVLIEFCNTFIDFKWLYTLWIAETEIIDDLEELNNVKN